MVIDYGSLWYGGMTDLVILLNVIGLSLACVGFPIAAVYIGWLYVKDIIGIGEDE
jgi:hypothetical protein